ncbi:MAG: hypothetical protein K1X81_07125 [Bacteroidia bacterium]|nr:hypothetical protein [Bacteroidia bacterium]
MKNIAFKTLLPVFFLGCFISCSKEDAGVQSLNLSGYTGLFYCRYDNMMWMSGTPQDTGYAYLRIVQKQDVWATLVVANLGPDTTTGVFESFEVDLSDSNSFSRYYNKAAGCSHCRYISGLKLEYHVMDSISFVVTSETNQPIPNGWDKIYKGKRVW